MSQEMTSLILILKDGQVFSHAKGDKAFQREQTAHKGTELHEMSKCLKSLPIALGKD